MNQQSDIEMSVCEEEPDILTKMATHNPIHPELASPQSRPQEEESIISPIQDSIRVTSQYIPSFVHIMEDAKETINQKNNEKRKIEIANSQLSLHAQTLREEINSIKKQEKQLLEKVKKLKKLLVVTQNKFEEDKTKLKQYINISQELISQNYSSNTVLKKDYDQLALSINVHLNKINDIRQKYPDEVAALKKQISEYDQLNLTNYKQIEEYKKTIFRNKEEEANKLRLIHSKSRILLKCIKKDVGSPKYFRSAQTSRLHTRPK